MFIDSNNIDLFATLAGLLINEYNLISVIAAFN